ncbi:MAG: glycine cleavage system protein GcvH [Actinobacteria bacterium]|nr:glycine cleavage system protein GcvH [Actinomycetota bacterium]
MIPQDLKFSKSHEWARFDKEANTVTVGLSAFAVEQLGDIVFVELPEVGQAVTAESPFGVIESVKAAVDLYAPISGEVVEINQTVAEQLDLLSSDPYGQAWMIKITPRDLAQLDTLMSPADYETFIKSPEAQH